MSAGWPEGDRSQVVARSIQQRAAANAAVRVMPKGTNMVIEPTGLHALASFRPAAEAAAKS